MGKRKSRKAPAPKGPKVVVPKVFDCPFCGHEKSVTCKVFRDLKEALIKCRVCAASYKSGNVHNLTAPIDIYHEWLDESAKANEDLLGPVGEGAEHDEDAED